MDLDTPERLMIATYRYYGILTRRHAKLWFWPDKTDRAMEKALKKLKDGEYINWASDEERARHKIPEPFIWLDWRGILFIAAHYGIEIEEPDKMTLTWKRETKKQLAASGIYWMMNPAWSSLRHDILCTDMSIRLRHDIETFPHLEVKHHLADHAFRTWDDKVEFVFPAGSQDKQVKAVLPDIYFTVLDHQRQQRGEAAALRLPIEVDNATHPEASAIALKLTAGAYWLASPAYKKRLGDNSGIWLVITTGDKRLQNMMEQVREQKVAWAHLFTTIDEIAQADNLFLDPLWRYADQPETLIPFPL